MVKPRKHNVLLYRSGLEDKVAEQLAASGTYFEYETVRVKYTTPPKDRVYTPDFKVTTESGKIILVETKGIWDSQDRYKHLLIRQQHPELDIRFLFQNSKAKIRKGSSTTYADICNGLGRAPFKGTVWLYSDKHIPLDWLRE